MTKPDPLAPELRERARACLRSNPAISGLNDGHFKLIEETEHELWDDAVAEARLQFILPRALGRSA